MVVFKMRDSVPSPRYSPICNVLRQWKTSLIPTYRVYRDYDIYTIRLFLHTVTVGLFIALIYTFETYNIYGIM